MENTKIDALFVDRDGTLIEDKHYLSDPAGVCLLGNVAASLKIIQEQGIRIFIVTNQSGIGREYFAEKDFFACQAELEKQLRAFGVTITDTAFCPHDPSNQNTQNNQNSQNEQGNSNSQNKNCNCRKPNLGMWEQLSAKHDLVASRCAMIGDKKEDVGFGLNAGFALSALIATGKGMDSAKKLGITFTDKAQAFLPHLISETPLVNSNSQCVSVQNFADFTRFLFS